MSYSDVYQAGVDATMTEVAAAARECDGTATDMFLRIKERVARGESQRRRSEAVDAMPVVAQ